MNPDLAPRRTQRDTEKCKREKQNIWFRYKGKIVTRESSACHSEPRLGAGEESAFELSVHDSRITIHDSRKRPDPSSAFGMTGRAVEPRGLRRETKSEACHSEPAVRRVRNLEKEHQIQKQIPLPFGFGMTRLSTLTTPHDSRFTIHGFKGTLRKRPPLRRSWSAP